MSVTVEPEPTEAEREAILAALAVAAKACPGAWAEAALQEGVASDDDP